MSMIERCAVCAATLNPYGQETRCDRCYAPCRVCGKDVMLCSHKLTQLVERDLKATIGLQRGAA